MENISKSNALISVMHLKEASNLLLNVDEDISTTLLKLSQYLIEQNGLLSSDIEDAQAIVDNMTSKDEEVTIHRADSK